MSSLKYLEKLLDRVEVVWMPLAEVVEFKRGEQLKPIDIIPGVYPIVTASKSEVGSHADWNFGPVSVTVTSHGAYAGHVNYWPTPIWLANNVYLLSPTVNLNKKFLYFFLKSNELKIQGLAKGGGVPYFNTRDLAPLLIPIPCPDNPQKSLEIQAEIVRILDTFTELTAELAAELAARKKQYNYYRDQLLSFEEGAVEWKTLGDEEFFEVTSGGTPSTGKPEYWDNGNIPWLKSESCNNEPVYSAKNFITELGLKKSSAKLLQKETTLIALVGATIFKIAFLEFPAATNQNIASIKSKNSEVISDKFVFYFLTSLYEKLKSEMRSYGMLNLSTLRQFKIPVPSPEEQTRIVAILDKFDALTNSLTEGLPREIELRQKQYEYYRDLLLSFPKQAEVTG